MKKIKRGLFDDDDSVSYFTNIRRYEFPEDAPEARRQLEDEKKEFYEKFYFYEFIGEKWEQELSPFQRDGKQVSNYILKLITAHKHKNSRKWLDY